MIQQRMHHIGSEMPNITISQASFAIGWRWKDGDNFGIEVTPDDMDWTVAIEETGGQGTSWVTCVPLTGTGDREDPNMRMTASEENDTGNLRTADVRFSDDASEADDVVIVVTQEANPV